MIHALGMFESPLALTDKEGEATIDLPAKLRVSLAFENAGGAYAMIEPRRFSSDERRVVEVHLNEPTMIQGSVVDAATGHAVPGAAIWTRSDPGRRALSDASGVFNLSTPVYRSDVGVRVSAAGFVTANARIGDAQPHAASDPTIVLQPAAPFFGSVVDEAGRPVGGASIRAEPSGRGRLRAFPAGEPRRARSAPDGSFWISDAPYETSYRLIVEATGHPPSMHDLSPFRRDRLAEPVLIVLPTGRRPWGTVVDPEGAPIADALVRLLWPPPDAGSFGRPLMVAIAATVPSTAKGNFLLASIAPGRYLISISHPDYAELR